MGTWWCCVVITKISEEKREREREKEEQFADLSRLQYLYYSMYIFLEIYYLLNRFFSPPLMLVMSEINSCLGFFDFFFEI